MDISVKGSIRLVREILLMADEVCRRGSRPSLDSLRFGLEGGFPGDEELMARGRRLAERVVGDKAGEVGVDEILELLDQLPFRGRMEFAVSVLMLSSAREDIIRRLMDSCFSAGEDESFEEDGFVIMTCGTTKHLIPSRYSLLRILVKISGELGNLGVELYREYSKTTSTVFKRAFLQQMISSPNFKDSELADAFLNSVEIDRKILIKYCTRFPHRRAFIDSMLKKGCIESSYIHWCPPESISNRLVSPLSAEANSFFKLGLKNWNLHGDTYIKFLEDVFHAYKSNPLAQSAFLRKFESAIDGTIGSEKAMEIYKICDKYNPLEISPSPTDDVREYLETLSMEGKLRADYEFIQFALPSKKFFRSLSSVDKFKIFRDHLIETDIGFKFSDKYKSFCKAFLNLSHKKFHRSALIDIFSFLWKVISKISINDLWRVILEKHVTDEIGETFLMVKSFIHPDRITQIRLSHPTIDVWEALHMRSIPTLEVLQQYPEKTMADLWKYWLEHFLSFLKTHFEYMCVKGRHMMGTLNIKANRTPATCYLGYLAVMLENYYTALTAPSFNCDIFSQLELLEFITGSVDLLTSHFRDDNTFGMTKTGQGYNSYESVKTHYVKIFKLIIERLDSSIIFSPRSDLYLPRCEEISKYLLYFFSANKLRHFPSLQDVWFTLAESIINRALLTNEKLGVGFVEVKKKNGKVGFAHFQKSIHAEYVALGLDLLRTLLFASKNFSELVSVDLVHTSWKVYRQHHFPNLDEPGRTKEKLDFLRIISKSHPSILELERTLIIEIGVAQIKANSFESFARYYVKFELLNAILETISDVTIADNWRLRFGSISSPKVRKLVEDAISDRDASTRMSNLVAYLNRSVKLSFSEVATSLRFAQRRISNEAGLYRPQIYDWVNKFISLIVDMSFDEDDLDSAFDSAMKVTKALEKMIRDDVSKRDSVAKNSFRSIGQSIVSAAILFPNSVSKLKLRQLWTTCGILLEMIVLKTIYGEQGWKRFTWSLESTFTNAHSVEESDLKNVFLPVLEKGFENGRDLFLKLKQLVYSSIYYIHCDPSNIFSPHQAVEVLFSSLAAAQQRLVDTKDIQASFIRPSDYLEDQYFIPATKDSYSAHMAGMKNLMSHFCIFFFSIPCIIEYFEAILEGLKHVDDPRIHHHFTMVHELFLSALEFNPNSLWYENPILAKSCQLLLEVALRKNYKEAKVLIEKWIEMKKFSGKVDLSGCNTSQRFFFLGHVVSENFKFFERSSNPERISNVLRELLSLNPSTFYYLKDLICDWRDDLFSLYLKMKRADLHGIFDPSFSSYQFNIQEKTRDIKVSLSNIQVEKLSGSAVKLYTRLCFGFMMDPTLSASIRSSKCKEFVQSPGSSFTEIIDLLKLILRNSTEEDEKPDESSELLFESIILSVFQTDAAWFVLEFLLSPEVILTSSQRTTASVLSKLKSWMPASSISRVIEILLEPKRRWAIKLYLHKCIMRLLFELDDSKATDLFLNEWRNRKKLKVHKDIEYDIASMCIKAICNNSSKASAGWEVMTEIANDHEAETDLLILLFLPSWAPQNTQSCPHDVYSIFTLPRFPERERESSFNIQYKTLLQHSLITFADEKTSVKLYEVLCNCTKSKDSFIRTISLCKQFSLSTCVIGNLDNAIDDIHSLLKSFLKSDADSRDVLSLNRESIIQDEEAYLIQTLTRYWVTFSMLVMSKAWNSYSQADRMNGTAWSNISSMHKCAISLKEFVNLIFKTLLETPPLELGLRLRLTTILQIIFRIMSDWENGREWYFRLIESPFSKEIAYLRADADEILELM